VAVPQPIPGTTGQQSDCESTFRSSDGHSLASSVLEGYAPPLEASTTLSRVRSTALSRSLSELSVATPQDAQAQALLSGLEACKSRLGQAIIELTAAAAGGDTATMERHRKVLGVKNWGQGLGWEKLTVQVLR